MRTKMLSLIFCFLSDRLVFEVVMHRISPCVFKLDLSIFQIEINPVRDSCFVPVLGTTSTPYYLFFRILTGLVIKSAWNTMIEVLRGYLN